jgi:hypothetical protein
VRITSSTDQSASAEPPPAAAVAFKSAAGRWVLAVAVMGSGMVFLDGTVVNVALPRIGRGPLQEIVFPHMRELS